jgi:hypothetical protein
MVMSASLVHTSFPTKGAFRPDRQENTAPKGEHMRYTKPSVLSTINATASIMTLPNKEANNFDNGVAMESINSAYEADE